jgi:hypothetical protein
VESTTDVGEGEEIVDGAEGLVVADTGDGVAHEPVSDELDEPDEPDEREPLS